MCDKAESFENNPFAYLFPSLEAAEKYSREAAAKLLNEHTNLNDISSEEQPSTSNCDKFIKNVKNSLIHYNQNEENNQKIENILKEDRINKLAENIFGFTLNKSTNKSLVSLNEFECCNSESTLIDLSNLEQILFERLLLEDPTKFLVNGTSNAVVDGHIVQTEVITYLIECHKRLNKILSIKKNDEIKEELEAMQVLIARNASTALRQPELYENQNLSSQVLKIFYENADTNNENVIISFFHGIVMEIIKDEPDPLEVVRTTFEPIFNFVHKKIANQNLINFEHVVIHSFLQTMASDKYLAETLIDYTTPKTDGPGIVYSDTLLGAIFCLSCLPKIYNGPYEYFDSHNITANKTVEDTVWTSIGCICDNLHQLFLTLLKISPEVKHKTLQWLADCLHHNARRGKLGINVDEPDQEEFRRLTVSDGFMLNLSGVLLRLCQPFVTPHFYSKILKIDPTYCAAKISNKEEGQKRNCHMHNLDSETCLLPNEGRSEIEISESFNFITECFFLAQKSLDLGFRVCVEKLHVLIKELAKIEQAYKDAVATRGANHEVTKQIQERLQADMTKYFSIRAALIEPKFLNLLCKLHAASSNWLIQIFLSTDQSKLLQSMKALTIPIPEEVPAILKCVPEFIFLNLTSFLAFIRQFNRKTLEENGFEWLDPILSVIIIFMGSSKRLSNPHLRAELAESMEALLPNNDDDMSLNPNPISTICREQLFRQHPLVKLIVPSLLNVFVSIEVTGQSVEFQEKFNYRRPMYVIMDYLWSHEQHKTCFKNLALEAEKNMEAVSPPLFLRFLNLLVNDAVFLLDEALSNMAQLKTMQAARESGEWAKLPVSERVQNESFFLQAGMHAKFDNILGQWTIHTLEFLTSEIKSIFYHPVMVDRMVGMLNYFLHRLVGPNKKDFKVKDKEEYKFKPDVFVMDICKIYIHLYESDSFCLAISRDGRSYNSELFGQAQDVLARIGGGALIGEMKLVDEKVSSLAIKQRLEEEMLPDAPEEFLDPIMSTIMTDPVILPSSQQVVDRTTIARHLLSDESDPFNRSPLTLDKVKPHTELREKIEKWIEERRNLIEEQHHKKNPQT